MDGWLKKLSWNRAEGSSSHPTEALVKIIKMKR